MYFRRGLRILLSRAQPRPRLASAASLAALGLVLVSAPHVASAEPKLKVKDDTESQAGAAQRRKQGEFVRGVATARSFVEDDPHAEFPVEEGRYHLYLSYNCPWCHRVALTRALMGLQGVVTMDVLMPVRTEADHLQGEGKWQFLPEGLTARNGKFVKYPECTVDTVGGYATVVEIYRASGLQQTSVPILYDKKTRQVVNNESSEIMRMLAVSFARFASPDAAVPPSESLFPTHLAGDIERINEMTYNRVNNGAYKAGFTSKQAFYEEAYHKYFAALDELEEILSKRKFLCGPRVTEADVRLFPTVFRHDPVYYSRMKLNKKWICDYPNLWRWMCDFYALPGVKAECPLDHMKQGYFGRTGNGTVPVGPEGYPELLSDPSYAARRVKALSSL